MGNLGQANVLACATSESLIAVIKCIGNQTCLVSHVEAAFPLVSSFAQSLQLTVPHPKGENCGPRLQIGCEFWFPYLSKEA